MPDHDRPPRVAPFALDYERARPVNWSKALARFAIVFTKIAAILLTIPGFALMFATWYFGDSPGWGTGAIGATLLIAGAIFITANHYLQFWTAR